MSKRAKRAAGGAPARPVEPPVSKPAKRGRRSKPATQVAALCHEPAGRVLLITSRDTGRWVIPKGWPMRKRSLPASAAQEAWEEAGVQGSVTKAEIGRYRYDKRRDHGFAIPVEVRVYPIAVTALADLYPEADQRKRAWFPAEEAAEKVAEAELKALIRSLPERLEAGLARVAKKR